MTPEQIEVLRQLRHEGYAVIVWTPEELCGVRPKYVEEGSISHGYDLIDAMKEEPDA